MKSMDANQKTAKEIKRIGQAQKPPTPYMVKLVEVVHEDDKVYLVTEFMSGGNLLSRVIQQGVLPESQVKQIAHQLIHGVLHLHEEAFICHNDLQPSNILLADDTYEHKVKISDFGSATTKISTSTARTLNFACQPPYRAPERQASPASDMWSIGVILYFCLLGQDSVSEIPYDDIIDRLHKNKVKVDVSRHAKQFLCNLIHLDPDVRLTAQEALMHPWINGLESSMTVCDRAGTCSDAINLDKNPSMDMSRTRRPGKRFVHSIARFFTNFKGSDNQNGSSKDAHNKFNCRDNQDVTESTSSTTSDATRNAPLLERRASIA